MASPDTIILIIVDYHTAIGEPRPPAPTPSYAPAPIQRQEGARESLSGRIAVASQSIEGMCADSSSSLRIVKRASIVTYSIALHQYKFMQQLYKTLEPMKSIFGFSFSQCLYAYLTRCLLGFYMSWRRKEELC